MTRANGPVIFSSPKIVHTCFILFVSWNMFELSLMKHENIFNLINLDISLRMLAI